MSVNADSAKKTMKHIVQNRPSVHPGTLALAIRGYEYAPPPHLRDLYGKVWRAFNPDYPRAPKNIVELHPREHGKSDGGTVDNATWRAISDTTSRTLIMSEGAKLAQDKLKQCRQLIEEHGDRFGVEIEDNNKSQITLVNDANHGEATIEAAGFGSSVTGGHFEFIIFDDLVDWPSQRTEARREKIEKQFQNYLNLGTEGDTVFLVVGTRKHPEDLYDNLLDNSRWMTTVNQAISDWSIIENGDYDLITVDPDSGHEYEYPATEIGEIPPDQVIVDTEPYYDVDVLWPERWPLNKLILDMHTGFGGENGNLVWKRENQNDASALQGQILNDGMLTFTPRDEFEEFSRLSWRAGLDPAVEDDPEKAATNDTDYWGLGIVAHDSVNDVTFVPEVKRRRGLTMKQGLSWVEDVLDEYPQITTTMVEDQQAQRWFVQTAKDMGLNVQGTSSKDSKEERIIQMSSRFESGKVRLVGAEDDWTSFVNEWASFPTGDHDDRLDATEIALRGVTQQSVSLGNHDMSDLPV